MKNVSLLILALILSSCIAEREFIIDYDYSYRGDFSNYRTFSFMTPKDTINFNGISDRMIKGEIVKRMKTQGYKPKDKRPDILISYRVYGDNMAFKGYKQLDLDSWNKLYGSLDDNEEDPETVRAANYDERELKLNDGTLLIVFIDRRTNSVIWQGYASGLFNESSFFVKDAKYAVRTVLNQYRLLAFAQQ
ncbi:MAG: hypothetical protein ACI9A7_001423 [Cyclobacteriaceae bacterium]|jgi:hypothetical protein